MSYDIDLIRRYRKVCEDGEVEVSYDTICSWTPTYNYREMLIAAGIYDALVAPHRLHPDYAEGKSANDLTVRAKIVIKPLELGLENLLANPDHFKQFNPSNGWGSYDDLIDMLSSYLNDLKTHPNAEILTAGYSD